MNNDATIISDILNDGIFNSKKAQVAFKYSTIFSFWGQIAGKKFAHTSKPYKIKGSKIYVCCENSYVVQELIMYKKILLSKLKIYSEPLGISIEDMVFEYKNWQKITQVSTPDDYPDFYTDKVLESTQISQKEFEELFLNIDKSEYLNTEQKEKFKYNILKLQKAKKLRQM